MEKAYTRTNWVDDTEPFIDAEHLNNIESGIDTLDDRVVELSGQVEGKTDVIIANAQGESIHLEDSAEGNAVEFKLIDASGSVEVKSLGKNFIPYPYYENSHADNGITWTVNEDGKVIANGTASATSNEILSNVNIQGVKLPAGKYLLTGCPAGGSNSTYRMWVNRIVDGSAVGFGSDFENGLTFELTEETYVGVGCQVVSGTTVSNLIFEPMISLEGGEFEPYKESITTINADESTEGEVKLFYPVTNILNDAGCEMEVTYKADTKNYIDKNSSSGGVEVDIATTENAGIVKPDGSTITVDTDGTIHAVGGGSGEGGTSDYEDLSNKPSINGITLQGNKTASALGIVVPTKTSQLNNDSNFVTQDYLKSLIETQSFSRDNLEISNYTTITFEVAKSGYTPLGVFLYSIENATSSGVGRVYCSVFEMSITNNVLTVGIKYTGNSSAKVKATFVVLYERD